MSIPGSDLLPGPVRDRARAARDRLAPTARGMRRRLRRAVGAERSFWEMPPEQAITVAYNVVLQRDPDPVGLADLLPGVTSGEIDRNTMVERLYGSDEAHRLPRFTELGPSLHASRCDFVHSLPRAGRIIDLGGTHQSSAEGAFVAMGYPYAFDELIIVDLPVDDRHPIYRDDAKADETLTALGPVRYRYHSMADLSSYDDASFDLVYSGQTIEHVTEADADRVLAEAHRVLRPGGWIAIDTPNGRATRLQQEEFIDPDHEVEYELDALLAKVVAAGFEVTDVKGLNHLGPCWDDGVFDLRTVAARQGVFADADGCYLLAVVARRPDR